MLGLRIAMLRRQRGLSQAELARRLHISASAVGMYEQGRREPSLATLVDLAKELNVSTDYLLTGDSLGDGAENVTKLIRIHEKINGNANMGGTQEMNGDDLRQNVCCLHCGNSIYIFILKVL